MKHKGTLDLPEESGEEPLLQRARCDICITKEQTTHRGDEWSSIFGCTKAWTGAERAFGTVVTIEARSGAANALKTVEIDTNASGTSEVGILLVSIGTEQEVTVIPRRIRCRVEVPA